MGMLGTWLRQTREGRGNSLQEAAAATHIRAHFLEMLEAGAFAALPGGDVQARGFLRLYARYLDLSPDEVLARYETEARGPGASPPSPIAPQPVLSAAPPTPHPPVRAATLLIVGLALLAALIMALIAVWHFAGSSASDQDDAAEPSEEALSPPQTPVVMPTFPASDAVAVTLEAAEHVWVRVTNDGVIAFEGMLAPGQSETWNGRQAIVVETGNGAGLRVTVNGQAQGLMGERSQISIRAWSPNGEIAAPTSTPAP